MAVAWEYHEATKHSADSLRRDRHYLDWPNQPRPVKRYAVNLPCVALPRDILPSVMPALQALRSQSDAYPQRAADVEPSLLATLLQLSAGITKWLRLRAGTMAFRAAACTGALYHIDLYLVCGDLPEIE